jgi:hypothetical protein
MSTLPTGRKLQVLVVLVVAIGLLAAAVGVAGAQGPDDGRQGQLGDGIHAIIRLGEIVVQTAADALDTTPAELLRNMEVGQSLNDYLTANGVDPSQVAADAEAVATDNITIALAEGRISQSQADDMLANLEPAIEIIMNRARQERPSLPGQFEFRAGLNVVATVAESLGLTGQEIIQELRGGKTLNEIITEHGGDVEAIKQTLIDNATERINTEVAEGRLTQERADELLQNLPDFIDRLLNGQLPERPGQPGPRGRGEPGRPGIGADGPLGQGNFQ